VHPAEVAHVHADERVGELSQHEERHAHPAQPGGEARENRPARRGLAASN
jgi:hypothetical protein